MYLHLTWIELGAWTDIVDTVVLCAEQESLLELDDLLREFFWYHAAQISDSRQSFSLCLEVALEVCSSALNFRFHEIFVLEYKLSGDFVVLLDFCETLCIGRMVDKDTFVEVHHAIECIVSSMGSGAAKI